METERNLKIKPFSTDHKTSTRGSDDTNRRVRKIINHHAHSASRGLSEGRVTETKLLDQESVVTKQVGGPLRARERGDRIGLGNNARPRSAMELIDWGCTNRVSDDQNRVFEFRRCVRGKPLNRADGPSKTLVAEEALASGNVLGG